MSKPRLFAAAVTLGLAQLGSTACAGAVYPGCASPPAAYAHVLAATPLNLPSVLARAEGGDIIVLAGGDYGPVRLAKANDAFVTLAAAKGQTPVFSSLKIGGSHWIVRGVAVIGMSPPGLYGAGRAHYPLVVLGGGDNFILEGNTISSQPGNYPWAEQLPGAPAQISTSDGIRTDQSACVAIVGNHITNVFNGMQLAGDQVGIHGRFYLVSNNTIDGFAGDGIDHSVSDAVIHGNIIANGHDICHNVCIHMDGIQGWTYGNRPGVVNHDVDIDGNTIIQQTVPSLILPADELHGITIFDGSWRHVRVTNNVVLTDTWHGMTISGVDDLLIANNTVLATTRRPTWIQVGGTTHQGGLSNHVVVRNNVATAVKVARASAPPPHMTIDHNLEVVDPGEVFVKFDVKHAKFDLHPKRKGPAVGRGSAQLAPSVDIDGAPRHPPITLGAYQ